jgi:hypothetical protein
MIDVMELDKTLNSNVSMDLSLFDTEDVARELEYRKINFHAVYAEKQGVIFVDKSDLTALENAVNVVETRREEAKRIAEDTLEKLKKPPKMDVCDNENGKMRITIPSNCVEVVSEEFASQGLPCEVSPESVIVRDVDVAFVFMLVAEKMLEDERLKMREERAKIRHREDFER